MSPHDRDRARGIVREAGGPELLERLEHLDRTRAPQPRPEIAPPDAGTRADFDVVLAGGGLSLLYAPVLADLGLSVAVLERGTAGAVHREWNASGPELAPLWESGIFDRGEVDDLVVARYREGVCRWHGGGSYPVYGVLDHAVDAGRLLAEVRRRAEDRGVHVVDRHAVVAEAAGPDAVAIRVETPDGSSELTAKVLLDARGASSPYATADLVCPTVGGVLGGLDVDPEVGDVLATTEGVDEGRQHVWEAFPGRPGETTVYLFYYARAEDTAPGALLDLYARFFERRPGYVAGSGELLRPTFGYIPGWSRLGAPPRTPSPRIALVGDAAARHSPLTWCGFGATLRSFVPAARRVAEALSEGRPPPEQVVEDRAIHGATGLLSMVMATPDPDPARAGDLNALLDAAFGSLYHMGNEAYAALIRDEMAPREFVRFLREVARRRSRVFLDVPGRLGLGTLLRWGGRVGRDAMRA